MLHFKTETAHPSKDASAYWQVLNRKFLDSDDRIAAIWREEKMASVESIKVARKEAITFLAKERERIMKLTREDAIKEVLKWRKIENRIRAVKSVADNGLLELE